MILNMRKSVGTKRVASKQKVSAMFFAAVLPIFGFATSAPVIVSVGMRAGNPTIMDVVYKVTSETNVVNVRALAFENVARNFQYVVRPKSFVKDPDGNETAGSTGLNITADIDFDRLETGVKVEEK